MFTGRIGEIGEIASFMDDRITVRAPKSADRVRPGGSLNVAGVCVTAEHVADGVVTATVSAETRRRTTFDCCGPIAVDGVSLAVAEVARDRFSVVLIPATLEQTTLGLLAEGDRVNLESDLLGRLAAGQPASAGADVARAVSSLGWGASARRRSPSCLPAAAGTPPSRAPPKCWSGWTSLRCRETATGTAPDRTFRLTWPRRPGPKYRD